MGDEPRDTAAKPRTPTTIGTGARAIGGDAAAARRPTVIGGMPLSVAHNVQVAPASSLESVDVRLGRISAETVCRPMPALVPRVPSQMNGTVRRAVSINSDALARLLPGVPASRLGDVADLMGSVVLDALTPVRAASWGDGAQRAYAEFVNDALVCAREPALEEGTQRLQRLHALLGEFASALEPEVSTFRSLLRRQSSPRALLDKHRVELDQLRRHLDEVLPKIEAGRGAHAALAERAARLSVSLQNHALAAQALAALAAPSDAGLERVFVERGMSLVRAVAQLRESELLRTALAERVDTLVITIRDVALCALPAWVEQATYAGSATPTETYSLHRGVLELLTNLRSRS